MTAPMNEAVQTGFHTTVCVREDGKFWLLLSPLIYTGKTDRFVVPLGFQTDFASVPHVLTWLVPRTGIYNRAAVLHDYLCKIASGAVPSQRDWVGGSDEQWHALPAYITRKDADGVFRRVLRELQVGAKRRRIMYWGVRIGSLRP